VICAVEQQHATVTVTDAVAVVVTDAITVTVTVTVTVTDAVYVLYHDNVLLDVLLLTIANHHHHINLQD